MDEDLSVRSAKLRQGAIALSPDFIGLGGGGIVAFKISLLAVGSELVGKTAIFKVRCAEQFLLNASFHLIDRSRWQKVYLNTKIDGKGYATL